LSSYEKVKELLKSVYRLPQLPQKDYAGIFRLMVQYFLHGAYLCPLGCRRCQNTHGDDSVSLVVDDLEVQLFHENSVQHIKVELYTSQQ